MIKNLYGTEDDIVLYFVYVFNVGPLKCNVKIKYTLLITAFGKLFK